MIGFPYPSTFQADYAPGSEYTRLSEDVPLDTSAMHAAQRRHSAAVTTKQQHDALRKSRATTSANQGAGLHADVDTTATAIGQLGGAPLPSLMSSSPTGRERDLPPDGSTSANIYAPHTPTVGGTETHFGVARMSLEAGLGLDGLGPGDLPDGGARYTHIHTHGGAGAGRKRSTQLAVEYERPFPNSTGDGTGTGTGNVAAHTAKIYASQTPHADSEGRFGRFSLRDGGNAVFQDTAVGPGPVEVAADGTASLRGRVPEHLHARLA